MTYATSHLRFPSFPMRSAEDFQRFEDEHRELLDERLRQEMLFMREKRLTLPGTCGACLRVTQFTSHRATPHGTYARDQQICGCEAKLTSHRRALLHLAASSFGQGDWFRLGLLGRDEALEGKLAKFLPPAWIWPDQRSCDGATHMVLSIDTLATVPSVEEALLVVAQALLPGGLFLFTLPFDPRITQSPPAWAGSPRSFGWDILDKLRESGFQDCVAHCYWSVEFGLLGPDAMILKAFR